MRYSDAPDHSLYAKVCVLIVLHLLAWLAVEAQTVSIENGDAFFHTNDDLSKLSPGDIIRTRKVDIAFDSPVTPFLGDSWQLLYRTVDASGERPQANVVTVLAPKHKKSRDKIPLVLHSIPYDSDSPHCGPSYQCLQGANDTTDLFSQAVFFNHYLRRGYYVALADYEGPLAGFTHGPLAATGNLDALRAILSFRTVVPANERLKVKIALQGYSGGALATAWTLQRLNSYAPDVAKYVVGGAYGGVPVNVFHDFNSTLNGQTGAYLAGAGLFGLYNVDQGVSQYLDSIASWPTFETLKFQFLRTCSNELILKYAWQDILGKLFTIPVSKAIDTLEKKFPSLILSDLYSTPSYDYIPHVPVLIFQGMQDEVLVGSDVDLYVESLCSPLKTPHNSAKKKLIDVHYIRVPTGSHAEVGTKGVPYMLTYIQRLLELPSHPTTTCQIETKSLDPTSSYFVHELGPQTTQEISLALKWDA